MFDFHEKRKIRNLLYSKPSIVAVLVLAVLLSFSVSERYAVEREMAEKRSVKERELEALEMRAALLEEKVGHLQNDRGIEEELRSRFDVAKEGEQVVIILDDDESEQSLDELGQPPGSTSKEEDSRSFFDVLKFW